MAAPEIGFIGFGEVGYTFSRVMNEAGAEVTAYDVLLDDDNRADDIRKRITETGSKVGTLENVAGNNEYILSTVTTQVATNVAQTVAPMLKPGQIYVDLNSTCPSVKVEIGGIITANGADFVEGAILGAVGATGVQTRIFTAGKRKQEVADLFNRMGMNVQPYSDEIGKASTFKMLRSIFSKGAEILLLEMLVAAQRANIDEDLWKDITHFMSSKPFEMIGDNWMRSHAVACERRYYEMLQVVETMKELDIEPVMSERIAVYFKQSVDMDMSKVFHEKPESFHEVTKFISENLRR
jgi:3-hydroxyisobutyrate dehydrogenase-like beta-hydroxyacid dehydrogenase